HRMSVPRGYDSDRSRERLTIDIIGMPQTVRCSEPGGLCEALGMQIGVLGGTGPAGRGIATRLAAAGHEVILGSREQARAQAVVDDLRALWGERVAGLSAGTNHDAADADLVVLATDWDAAVPTATAHADPLAG